MREHSSQRINKVIDILNFNNYLEVGVNKGDTFFKVNCSEKIGVDPNFLFDYEKRSAENIGEHFCLDVSDNYFKNISKNDFFDLIFLDGLHTFDQTLRDWCNAVNHAHERTVIFIDDTIPCDAYSANPNQREAINRRAKDTGLSKGSWHGDVYKVVFFIEKYFTGWSYKTIISGGNAQTVLWKEQRSVVNPLKSISEIENMDYFKFRRNIGKLNPVRDFDEITNAIIGARK